MKINKMWLTLLFTYLTLSAYTTGAPYSPVLSENHNEEVEIIAQSQQNQLQQLVQNQEYQTQTLADQQRQDIQNLVQDQQQQTLNELNADVEDNFEHVLGEIKQENDGGIEQVILDAAEPYVSPETVIGGHDPVDVLLPEEVLVPEEEYDYGLLPEEVLVPEEEYGYDYENPSFDGHLTEDTNGEDYTDGPDYGSSGYGDMPTLEDSPVDNYSDHDVGSGVSYGTEDENVEDTYDHKAEEDEIIPEVNYGSIFPNRDNFNFMTPFVPNEKNEGGWFQSIGDKWNKWADHVANVGDKIGDQVGASLTDVYRSFESGLPSLWQQLQNTLQNFGTLVQKGSKCFVERVTLTFDDVKGSDLVARLEKHLDEGNEVVDRFLQKVGEKLATWENEIGHANVDSGLVPPHPDNHNVDPHFSDIFKDQEILNEFSKMVDAGILNQEEVDVLTGGEIKQDRETVYKAIHFPKDDYSEKIRYPIKPIRNPHNKVDDLSQNQQNHYDDYSNSVKKH